jgi:hypothetical protein
LGTAILSRGNDRDGSSSQSHDPVVHVGDELGGARGEGLEAQRWHAVEESFSLADDAVCRGVWVIEDRDMAGKRSETRIQWMHFLADQETLAKSYSLCSEGIRVLRPTTGNKVHRWIEAELIGQADRPAMVQADKRLG